MKKPKMSKEHRYRKKSARELRQRQCLHKWGEMKIKFSYGTRIEEFYYQRCEVCGEIKRI